MEDGSDAARGRMSRLDGLMAGCPGFGSMDELCVESGKSGQIRGILWMETWEKMGGKLDLPATHEIRGSNPTKLHHTNKSQKKIGAIFGGDFRI